MSARIPRAVLHRLERLPLALKVVVLNAFVGVLLTVLALTLTAWIEYRAAVTEFRAAAATEARLIGEMVSSALVFRDRENASRMLESLRRRDSMDTVWIFDRDGAPFAYRASADALRHGAESRVPEPGAATHLTDGILETHEPVVADGATIGTIVTRVSLAPVHSHLLRSIVVSGSVFAIVFSLMLGLLAWLVPRLMRRLSQLKTLMAEVAEHGDYAARAPDTVPDEIGALARVFNGMLEQIQRRDSHLERELAERRRAETQLAYTAMHDAVTGLPNRHYFNEALSRMMAGASERGRHVALMFLDLDNFKQVNDTLGHDVGDALLASVARRLRERLREDDLVCRLGGDEFAVVLEHVDSNDDALEVAAKLLEALFQPFLVGARNIHTGTSIGVAVSGPQAPTAEQLLKNADVAMYQAKSQGRGQVTLHHAALNANMARRTILERDLRAAMDQAEMEIHYQPQIDAARGYPVAFDATVHWLHPRFGAVPHDEVLQVAEESGQIGPFGVWLLRTTCADCAAWQSADLHGVSVSAGVTARQLANADFPVAVAAALASTGLAPDYLELELKEAAVLSRSAKVIAGTLSRLHALGVRLALDAFASGHTSLTHLRRLPISFLKLDASFVSGLPDDPDARTLAAGILALATSLDIRTSAEGVRTREQAEFLASHGCTRLQGDFVAPRQPLPALLDTLDTFHDTTAA